MPKMALVLSIILTAFLSHAHTPTGCTVSPKALLTIAGKRLPFSWSEKSPLVRAFQDIGYTAGPLKEGIAVGEKEAFLALFCAAERPWNNIVYSCAAAIVVSENPNGNVVKIATTSTPRSYDGQTLEAAINLASKEATRILPRCVSN